MTLRLLLTLLLLQTVISGCRTHIPELPLLATQQWEWYRSQFVTPEGRIIDRGNGEISHSEGQGYGMLLAAAAGDRQQFEAIWHWSQQHLQRPDALFSWSWQQGRVTDPNNASDGDILIAWALLSGYQRWGERQWKHQAQRILNSISRQLVVTSAYGPLLLPGRVGFVSGTTTTINLSYWVFPALHHFSQIDTDGPWQALIESGHRLIDRARFSTAQLPADWIDISGQQLSISKKYPPRFGYDALRIPLYLCWERDVPHQLMQQVGQFWHQSQQSAWIDLATDEPADYRLSDGLLTVPTLLASCLGIQSTPAVQNPLPEPNYYAETIRLLASLAQQSHPGEQPL